jgi:hypothetical protein
MPKIEIDYSNTIIYKISCKSASITEVYVGHTTNFVQRKHSHKQNCINKKLPSYKCKLYEVIRNNGGWDNWTMEIVGFFKCADHYEARKKEQDIYESLNATLNSIEPLPKNKIIRDNTITVAKNITATEEKNLETKFKETNLYKCSHCNYTTIYKSNFEKHNGTVKHIKKYFGNSLATNSNILATNSNILATNEIKYMCQYCNKVYQDRTGLWRHNKICNYETKNDINHPNNIDALTNLVLEVVKSNNELQKQNNELHKNVMDIYKHGTSNTNIQNINSNNKTFNLNVFLNETCKDAMNITDFVDSLKIQLSDLEGVGKLGFVEGISNIIVKNLKALDVHKRPVHCSDSKREVMYIKDEDKWEKENEEKNKLRKVIKKIANKNSRLLPQFKEKYPDCGKSDSKFSDQYNKLIVEAMGGSGDNDYEKEDKIIKKIAKEVIIDKTECNH